MWSMGDLFPRWLTPPACPRPIAVYANRFEIFAYGLPDEGRLADYLLVRRPIAGSSQRVGETGTTCNIGGAAVRREWFRVR